MHMAKTSIRTTHPLGPFQIQPAKKELAISDRAAVGEPGLQMQANYKMNTYMSAVQPGRDHSRDEELQSVQQTALRSGPGSATLGRQQEHVRNASRMVPKLAHL